MRFSESFLRKLERLSVMSRRTLSGQLQGERRSPKRGQSVEFADFRPYAPGDDIRRIDWNAYARLERFFLKLFVEEEDLTVHILLDASPSMDWGEPNKLDYARRTAGALGYITLAGLDRVTATIFGAGAPGSFPPQRGKGAAHALFSFLDLANGSPPSTASASLNSSLQAYAARAVSPGPLFLISDLFEPQMTNQAAQRPDIYPALNALNAKGFETTILHILSPEEVDPNLSGDLKLIDRESGAEIEITADFELLQRYRDQLAGWQAELRAFCHPRNMHYLPVETTLPIEELLFAWLRRAAVIA